MISNNNTDPNNQNISNNDNTENSDDTLGENSGDSALDKGNEPGVQDKADDTRLKTVTPDNDNGDPGPSDEKPATNKQSDADTPSSNKGQGPSGENL